MGFAHLMEEHGFTQEDVAARLGAAVRRWRMPCVCSRSRTRSKRCWSTAAHGRARARAARGAGERSSRASAPRRKRRLVGPCAGKNYRRRQNPRRSGRARELSPDEAEFESRLRERFGTHVAIVRGGKGGKIELRFANEDELMRALGIFCSNRDAVLPPHRDADGRRTVFRVDRADRAASHNTAIAVGIPVVFAIYLLANIVLWRRMKQRS